MTDDPTSARSAKGVLRQLGGPVIGRVDAMRGDISGVAGDLAAVSARLDEATHNLSALQADHLLLVDTMATLLEQAGQHQAALDQLVADRGPAGDAARSLTAEFPHGHGAAGVGEAVRWRIEQHQVHVEAQLHDLDHRVDRDLADVRSMTRLTQALLERALPLGGAPTAAASAEPSPDPSPAVRAATPAYRHPVPTFDVLYRSFEDRFRGTLEEITSRQEIDYLPLVTALPNPELPVADLGCGRGELVRLLTGAGITALGVDSNQGQVADAEVDLFVEADLFAWLDDRDDASVRAVAALHVVEHLPLDLQIRLVFEARRVIAPGGVLILETPNALSLSTASSNFWLDPTHERPVHPLFLEFLAEQAGFAQAETRPLMPAPPPEDEEHLVPALRDLYARVMGSGDLALIATR